MSATIVVPCFNEAARLAPTQFIDFVEANLDVSILFVDDGSTDETASILRTLASHSRVSVLTLPKNQGKAEAVRRGLLAAMSTPADWIGYVDADLATPPAEIRRLIDIAIGTSKFDCVFGSRIRLCGSHISRSTWHHLRGRVFATLADYVLGAHVYDTQAGAKFFRNRPELRSCLESPFADRWSFDVELFGRLGRVDIFPSRSVEIPMQTWTDHRGSKVGLLGGVRAMASLIRVHRRLQRFAPHK